MVKAYIVVFTINMDDVSPFDMPAYIDNVKDILSINHLEDCLNASVLTYFIPVKHVPSSLSVVEFFVDEDTKPHSKDNYDVSGKTPDEIAQILTKVLKEKQ